MATTLNGDASSRFGRPGRRGGRRTLFPPTHWSVIQAAGREDPSQAALALEALCRSYWPAVYGFLRHHGVGPERAKDLTQDYFHHLISHNLPAKADRARGKFRTFLLVTLRHFLADRVRRNNARSRIPPACLISLEAMDSVPNLALTDNQGLSPEAAFDREWAHALVEKARHRLQQECDRGRPVSQFDLLKEFLPGGQAQHGYAQTAEVLGMSENAVKVRVHRLRQRFAEILRSEIARTLADPGEIETEVRHLIEVLSESPADGHSCRRDD